MHCCLFFFLSNSRMSRFQTYLDLEILRRRLPNPESMGRVAWVDRAASEAGCGNHLWTGNCIKWLDGETWFSKMLLTTFTLSKLDKELARVLSTAAFLSIFGSGWPTWTRLATVRWPLTGIDTAFGVCDLDAETDLLFEWLAVLSEILDVGRSPVERAEELDTAARCVLPPSAASCMLFLRPDRLDMPVSSGG